MKILKTLLALAYQTKLNPGGNRAFLFLRFFRRKEAQTFAMTSLVALLLILTTCYAQTVYNVSFDHRAILINGERQLFISGSIHYPRSTPSMWDDLMKRSKAAGELLSQVTYLGVNLIETYVFWNLHQPEPDM